MRQHPASTKSQQEPCTSWAKILTQVFISFHHSPLLCSLLAITKQYLYDLRVIFPWTALPKLKSQWMAQKASQGTLPCIRWWAQESRCGSPSPCAIAPCCFDFTGAILSARIRPSGASCSIAPPRSKAGMNWCDWSAQLLKEGHGRLRAKSLPCEFSGRSPRDFTGPGFHPERWSCT